jgi:hypothetical protein
MGNKFQEFNNYFNSLPKDLIMSRNEEDLKKS